MAKVCLTIVAIMASVCFCVAVSAQSNPREALRKSELDKVQRALNDPVTALNRLKKDCNGYLQVRQNIKTDQARQAMMKIRLLEIRKLNSEKKATYIAGVNCFAILFESEFKRVLTTFPKLTDATGRKLQEASNETTDFKEPLVPASDAASRSAYKLLTNAAVDAGAWNATALTLQSSNKTYAAARRLLQAGRYTSCHSADMPQSPPPSFDWRNAFGRNWVTPVKQQGRCGACWAFAAVAVLESHLAIYRCMWDLDISEQQAVDCTLSYGCGGGWMHTAWRVTYSKSAILDSSYPYTSGWDLQRGTCQSMSSAVYNVFNTWSPSTNIVSFFTGRNVDNVPALKQALLKGPVTAVVYVDWSFAQYRWGVLRCQGSRDVYNHGVTIVGYGTAGNGLVEDYWIVKNSWSTFWGDQGYVYISQQTAFDCGLSKWRVDMPNIMAV